MANFGFAIEAAVLTLGHTMTVQVLILSPSSLMWR